MVTLHEIHTLLARVDYPATKAMILDSLRAQEASDDVLRRVQALPEHYYGSANTVMDALQQLE